MIKVKDGLKQPNTIKIMNLQKFWPVKRQSVNSTGEIDGKNNDVELESVEIVENDKSHSQNYRNKKQANKR